MDADGSPRFPVAVGIPSAFTAPSAVKCSKALEQIEGLFARIAFI